MCQHWSSARVTIGTAPMPARMPSSSAASLLTFFALAFVWSWTCWLLAPVLQAERPFAATALSLAGGLGSSLAAVIVMVYGSGIPVLVLHTAVNAWS